MPDFSLLQTPNFAQAALAGYAAGERMGQERRRRAALSQYKTDPAGAISGLMESGDIDTATALQKYGNDQRASAALGNAFAPQTVAPALGAQPQGTITAAPPADDLDQYMPRHPDSLAPLPARVDPASIPEVRRPDGLTINMDAVRQLASIPGYADEAMKLATFAQNADKAQIEQVQRHLSAKGSAADYLLTLPAAERPAAFRELVPQLVELGFSKEDLAQADLSDQMLTRDRLMGMTFEQRMSDRNARADDARADANAAFTQDMQRRRLALSEAANARAAVRHSERDKDRAAIAAGRFGIPTTLDDLDY